MSKNRYQLRMQLQRVDTRTGQIDDLKTMNTFGGRKRNEDGEASVFNPNTKRIEVKRGNTPPMDNADIGRLLKLSHHLDERNRLSMDHTPMNGLQIGKITGMNKPNAYNFIHRCIEAGAMAKARSGYYLNPIYFNACKYLPYEVYPLFMDDLRKILPPDIDEDYRQRTTEGKEKTEPRELEEQTSGEPEE